MEVTDALRKRILDETPALFRALEQSWHIAQNSWLGVLGASLGSYDSYPHIIGVETHLTRLVQDCESLPKGGFGERLNAAEAYMLLSSALLHDFGKARIPGPRKVKHARETRQALDEHYSYLGIPSVELARSLGRICAYHCPAPGESRRELAARLSTTVIDPYGEIRERLLAGLLTLADEMDSSYTRALPPYLATSAMIPQKGWRAAIRGVSADPASHLVRMVTTPGHEPPANTTKALSEAPLTWTLEFDPEDVADLAAEVFEEVIPETGPDPDGPMTVDTLKKGLEMLLERAGTLTKSGCRIRKLSCWLTERPPTEDDCPGREHPSLRAKLLASSPVLHGLMVHGLAWLKPVPDSEAADPRKRAQAFHMALPEGTAMAMALSSAARGNRVLSEIREFLTPHGLFLTAWVVEQEEHLYNCLGEETCEPVVHQEYLSRAARAMWDLSAQVFGRTRFSYEELASHMGEPDVGRAKKAVRRISITTDTCLNQGGRTIHAGASHWAWQAKVDSSKRSCCYMSLKEVQKTIDQLGAPYGNE